MNRKQQKPVYRIIENPAADERVPYALLEPDGSTIVLLAATPSQLATFAFDKFGEGIEVRHDEDLVTYEQAFR